MRSKSFKKFYCQIIIQLEFLIKEISDFVLKRTLNTKKADKPDIKWFIVLPYAQSKCEDFAIRFKHLVNNNFPQLDFNVAYQTPKTIGSYFPFKDKRDMYKSMVIYNIKCTQSNPEYIGKKYRILSIRYANIKRVKIQMFSALTNHWTCFHNGL